MYLKAINLWSNKSLDMLLELLMEVLPEGTNLPPNIYGMKKMLHDLGLGCEKIDVSKHSSALFWKENKHLERCLVCDESRYKMSGKEDGQKKIPHKVLRYFPLNP